MTERQRNFTITMYSEHGFLLKVTTFCTHCTLQYQKLAMFSLCISLKKYLNTVTNVISLLLNVYHMYYYKIIKIS